MATVDPNQTFITSHEMLDALCDRPGGQPVIAIDTEFMGEDHFIPRLELIQVAADGVAAVIDFPAVGRSPDGPVLGPRVAKRVSRRSFMPEGGTFELFAHHAGRLPKPFFDTQIAAAMVGYGAQTAYANLVQRVQGSNSTRPTPLPIGVNAR